jgi:hypothetical protein
MVLTETEKGMNMISNTGELNIDELMVVSGGDSKTMGQVAAQVFLGKELPDPPPPLQPCPILHEVMQHLGSPS